MVAKEEEAAAAEVVVETDALTGVDVARTAEDEVVVELSKVEEWSKVSKCTDQKGRGRDGETNAPDGGSRGRRDGSGDGRGRHHTD